LIGEQHKRKAEKNKPKLKLDVLLERIKVQIVDLNIFVIPEKVDSFLGVLRMQVDPYYFAVLFLDLLNDCPKRLAGSTAYVQEVA